MNDTHLWMSIQQYVDCVSGRHITGAEEMSFELAKRHHGPCSISISNCHWHQRKPYLSYCICTHSVYQTYRNIKSTKYSRLQLASQLRELTSRYGITQYYLPPGRGDIPAFSSAKMVLNLAIPGGMQGWVDLVGWLHTEVVCPSKQGRLRHINDGANAPWKK